MATRLTEGQVQLRGASGVPMERVVPTEVDYMTAARAEANVSNVYAQILDRMATSINKYSAELRTKEGLDFVANNPVTPEDIQLAKEGVTVGLGGGIGKVSGDFPSFFNAAVRKARADELAGHFIIEANNEFGKLLVQIEKNEITADQVQNKIAALAGSFQKVVANADPDAALKVGANIKVHGSTVLNKAYETDIKREKNERITKFDLGFDNELRLLQATIDRGFWIDPETGKRRSIDEYADVQRKTIATNALLLGDAGLQKEYSTKFETALRTAKINAVTREITGDAYMADPMKTLAKIRAGDVGKMSPVLQQMIATDFDSVAKVTANFMVAVNNREAIEKQQKADAKAADEVQFADLYSRYLTARDGSKEQLALRGQIVDIYRRGTGAIPDAMFKGLFEKKEGKGNPSVWANAWVGIDSGSISSKEQIDRLRPQLSDDQYVGLIKHLSSDNRAEDSKRERMRLRLAKVPVQPGSPINMDQEQFKRWDDLTQRGEDARKQAALNGKPFTVDDEERMHVQRIREAQNSESAKAARNSLKTYEQKPWINGTITRDKLPALKQKAGNDINKQREVTRIEQLLNQAGE